MILAAMSEKSTERNLKSEYLLSEEFNLYFLFYCYHLIIVTLNMFVGYCHYYVGNCIVVNTN